MMSNDCVGGEDSPISYISLFSGIEAASVAWEPLGWKPLCFSEIDEFPSAVLAARYPDVPNLGNIKDVDWQDAIGKYGKPDVVIGGSPCFPAGTLVFTDNGFKPIETIVPGDMVVTHKGRLRRVQNVGRKVADTITLYGQGTTGIECTANHPFLSREKHKTWVNKERQYRYIPDSTSEWRYANDMYNKFWFNVCKVTEVEIPPLDTAKKGMRGYGYIENVNFTPEFFYMVGRWLGDGWVNVYQRQDRIDSKMKRVYICCAFDEADELEKKLSVCGIHFRRSREKTAVKFIASSTQLFDWLVSNFGKYAIGKNIPAWVLGMPDNLRHAILHGYLDADGCWDQTHYVSCTISKSLALGMKAIAGTLGYTASIHLNKNNRQAFINGRPINERPTYITSYWNKPRSAFFDKGGWFGKVRKVLPGHNNVTVYNLEVEEDHSYTVDGIAVHNCQSFSVAGKREGLNGASGLMYEYIRAIQEIRPGILLWENVPGALSSEHGQAFRQLLSSLDDIGYGLAWRVLDSEFWGVAQRRRRVFLVGCLGDPERAAKILFDEQSLYRNPKPSRVKRQEIAERSGNRSQGADTEGDTTNAEPADVIALQSDGSTSLSGNGAGWNDTGAAYTLNTLDRQAVAYRMIAINQRNEARYDGGDGQTVGAIPAQPGGKQMQCVIEAHGSGTDPDVVGALCASDAKQIGNQYVNQGKVIIEARHADSDMRIATPTASMRHANGTQTQRDANGRHDADTTQDDWQDAVTTLSEHNADGTQHDTASTAARAAERAIIMASGQSHAERLIGMSPTLAARQYKDPPILFMPDTDTEANDADGTHDDGKGVTYVVRRLMPIETERLQGFPDGWTDLTSEDAERIADIMLDGPFSGYDDRHAMMLRRNVKRWCTECPDGKRYKATGNSMAVPVIRWLGKRIAETASE